MRVCSVARHYYRIHSVRKWCHHCERRSVYSATAKCLPVNRMDVNPAPRDTKWPYVIYGDNLLRKASHTFYSLQHLCLICSLGQCASLTCASGFAYVVADNPLSLSRDMSSSWNAELPKWVTSCLGCNYRASLPSCSRSRRCPVSAAHRPYLITGMGNILARRVATRSSGSDPEMATGVRFELTSGCPLSVFETDAFSLSATLS